MWFDVGNDPQSTIWSDRTSEVSLCPRLRLQRSRVARCELVYSILKPIVNC